MSEPRVPPHSVETEQAVLGGLLIDNAAWHRVSDLIAETNFYREEHQTIYCHIKLLLEHGRPATINSVANALDAAGEIAKTGGIKYLRELAGNAPPNDGIRDLAGTVAEKFMLRQLLAVADEIATDALNPKGRHPEELVVAAETKIAEFANSSYQQWSDVCHINPLLCREIERIQDQHDRKSESSVIGVPSGFTDLDKMTLGFSPGDLIIIAGRPAMGKTALSLNIARHVGIVEGRPVLFFSMDGSDGDLIQQLIACVGQVDAQQLRSGKLGEKDWSRISYALGMLHEVPIYISETEGLSSDQLRSVTNRFCRGFGGIPSLIVVDFIQLMATHRPRTGQAEEMFKICYSLKALAKELGVPIIALSQLPGTVEQRINKHPMLSDLMDCGPVEQIADLILLLYRGEYYHADSTDQGLVELIIGKHRNGPTGTVRLAYNPRQVRFDNLNA